MTADVATAYPAPAKVNLTLHLLGKRADGYHLLDSLVVFAGVGDQLQVAPADRLVLDENGPGAGTMGASEDNLVLRAARLLIETCTPDLRAQIRLEKRLPVAAGLGGGSSDAAAALIALDALWDCGLEAEELQRLGAAVGADVPVCLYGRPAWVGGIGETLDAAEEVPPAWFVLVNPGVSLSTASVFRARSGGFSEPLRWQRPPGDAAALAAWLAEGRNDLQAPACALEPAIPAVLEALGATPDCLLARMSGSGATCFGLYADESEARHAASLLTEARPDWWVRAAPLLTDPIERG
ncbi:MAG: 4-(cytidine 5'-diphospho)-2-C-methyl-D-erythritol kinase [Kiloniellales bacterium]